MSDKDQIDPHCEAAKMLRADAFLLDADAFVNRCIDSFPCGGITPGSPEQHHMVDALESGRVSKLDVASAFSAASRTHPRPSPSIDSYTPDFKEGPIIGDDLVLAHPENNAAFVAYVARILEQTDISEATLRRHEIALNSKQTTRRNVIDLLAGRKARRQVQWLSDTCMSEAVVLATQSHAGNAVRIDALVWQQEPLPRGSGVITVTPGLVLASVPRCLRAGIWDLTIDLWQPPDATLRINVTANGGVTRILDVLLSGPCSSAFRLEFNEHDRFVRLTLTKPAQTPELSKMQLNEVCLEPRWLG